jgi:hypothetical protein
MKIYIVTCIKWRLMIFLKSQTTNVIAKNKLHKHFVFYTLLDFLGWNLLNQHYLLKLCILKNLHCLHLTSIHMCQSLTRFLFLYFELGFGSNHGWGTKKDCFIEYPMNPFIQKCHWNVMTHSYWKFIFLHRYIHY